MKYVPSYYNFVLNSCFMKFKKDIGSWNLGENKHSFIGEITENFLKVNTT